MTMRPVGTAWLFALLLLAGCGGTGGAASQDGEDSGADLTNIDPSTPLRDQIVRIPGVYLNSQGEIRVRGATGPPLYVVDGQTTVMDNVNFISAADVASVRVLKGPETAIYGVRGGRGVILINTKRGASQN